MNNATIILNNSFELMAQGILKGSGRFIEVETEEGVKSMELPEEIHTYARWKELGYQVRKGEHSNIKFHIWKHAGKKRSDNEESAEEIKGGRCFMKLSAFFTAAQVEKIAEVI